MKLYKTNIALFLILTLVTLLTGCDNKPKKESTRFLVVGHTYYMIRYPGLFERFVETMNRERDIDYAFFLGDLVSVNNDSEWKIVMDNISKLQTEVYITPGNHDVYKFPYVESVHTIEPYDEWKAEYISRIGYDYKVIHDDNANFVLINSADPLDDIKEFLDENVESLDGDQPNILMSHHIPWDDVYFKSGWKTWAHKSYRWNDIKPYLDNINYIIAGDRCDHCRSVNHMVPLEPGKIGYHIGIGGPGTPLYYFIAEIRNGEIKYEKRHVDVAPDHRYFTDWGK